MTEAERQKDATSRLEEVRARIAEAARARRT